MFFLRQWIMILVAIGILGGSVVSCGVLSGEPLVRGWTPAPVTAISESPTPVREILPTSTPHATRTAVPTRTKAPTPAETRTATATVKAAQIVLPTKTATPSPTPDRHIVIIREEDITKAIAGGAGTENGLQVTNGKVRLTGGKMTLSADELNYSFFQISDLKLVGKLYTQNGLLQLETESISPPGLVTALIPTIANQALAQYTSQWYVEDVQTEEGRLVLRVR